MKKIIPFQKDIIFKTNLAEITSISLEHTLQVENNNAVHGNFIISGDYKMSESSVHTDSFSYDLPFDITMDERYNLEKAQVDIDDFYYEIINSNVLSVHIDVLMDRLEEVLIPEPEILSAVEEEPEEREFLLEKEEEVTMKEEVIEEPILEEHQQEITVLPEESRCIEKEEEVPKKKEEEKREVVPNVTETVTSLFDQISVESETYKSYKVYIVREGDTLETILERYSISVEEMSAYNDLSEIKLGDKLIIPSIYA